MPAISISASSWTLSCQIASRSSIREADVTWTERHLSLIVLARVTHCRAWRVAAARRPTGLPRGRWRVIASRILRHGLRRSGHHCVEKRLKHINLSTYGAAWMAGSSPTMTKARDEIRLFPSPPLPRVRRFFRMDARPVPGRGPSSGPEPPKPSSPNPTACLYLPYESMHQRRPATGSTWRNPSNRCSAPRCYRVICGVPAPRRNSDQAAAK
jgi:hypothetical protein